MVRRMLALSTLALLIGAAPTPPPVTPVVVELFTSQGCSSCPPADAYLEELSRRPNIIVLARPVTYWDRLGWKDTLAREDNTQLQRRYATRVMEGSGVYTPQIVVQGRAGAVGSKRNIVDRLITGEKARPGPAIAARKSADGGRVVSFGAGAAGTLTLVAFRAQVVVQIGSGENSGRSVRYTNVVLSERVVAELDSASREITIPGSAFRTAGSDGHALLIRDRATDRLIAGRYL